MTHPSFQKLVFSGVAALALAGCAGPPQVTPGIDQKLVLEEFFRGKTVGRGGFVSAIAGVDRKLTVKTAGRYDGKTLTLVEDFFYDDGERDRKTWRFTRLSPGRYSGTREDVIGTADIRQVGGTVQLTYSADVKGKDGSKTRVQFADTIALIDAASARNKATVSKFGFPIGTVDIVFVKSR